MKNVNPIRDDNLLADLICYLRDTKNEKYSIMCLIALKTGLRINDVLNIKLKQISEKMDIKERKTGKLKSCLLDECFVAEIKEYAKKNRISSNEYIIPSTRYRRNKPLSRVQAYKMIKEASLAVGLTDIGTHSMRKTYAINLFQKTGDLFAVQKALNHKYVDTTIRYLMSDDMVLDFKPKAKD